MAIQIENLHKKFGEQGVLQHFNCTVQEGRINCIMGPSGSGKTTLLFIMMGIIKADSGKIIGLEGLRPSAVFQEDRLCENISALANVRLVCSKEVSKNEIRIALEEVGLAGSIDKPVRELSGGMKRRVAIVRALLAEFDILYLDEPFKGLDAEIKETVIKFIKEKCDNGKTVLFVTHDPYEAEMMDALIINL